MPVTPVLCIRLLTEELRISLGSRHEMGRPQLPRRNYRTGRRPPGPPRGWRGSERASFTGSLISTSPLRILTLNPHSGLVHTHALYVTDAPCPPKSDNGTNSPSPHSRHRGKLEIPGNPPWLIPNPYTPFLTPYTQSYHAVTRSHPWPRVLTASGSSSQWYDALLLYRPSRRAGPGLRPISCLRPAGFP